MYYNKWLKFFGIPNGLRRTVVTTVSDPLDIETRFDADFVISKLIGDLEVAVGGDRLDVLVNILMGDSRESLFTQPLPFDSVFGTPQFPNIISERFVPHNTRIFVEVTNNTPVTIEYNWLLAGFNNFFGNPYDVAKLRKDVFAQGRESATTWAHDEAGPAGGNIFPGGIIDVPAAPVGGSTIVRARTQQWLYPFLVRDIRSAGPALTGNVFFNFRDLSGSRDDWFQNRCLIRMAVGNASNPFIMDEFRPYNPVSYIEVEIENFETTAQRVPLSLWGMRAPTQREYNLADYLVPEATGVTESA